MKYHLFVCVIFFSIAALAQEKELSPNTEVSLSVREKAVIVLKNIVQDDRKSGELRNRAVKALGNSDNSETLPLLWNRYQESKQIEGKSAAILAIGKLGDREQIPKLKTVFEGVDHFETSEDLSPIPPSIAAGVALLTLKDRSGFVIMNAYLQGRDRQLQKRAASAFAETKDPSSIDLLVGLLGEKDVSVRLAAIEAVSKISKPRDPYIIASLKPLLDDSDRRIAFAAAKALAFFEDQSCRQLLNNELAKNKFQPDLLKKLYLVGEKQRAIDLVKLLSEELKENERREIEDALISIRDTAANKLLKEILEGKNRRAVMSAARILGENKDKGAIPALLRCLKKDDDKIQISAINALGFIGSKEAIEPLKSFMQKMKEVDPFETKKLALLESVAVALANLGDEDGTKYFIVEKKHKDRSYLEVNGMGLAKISNRAIVLTMIDILKNPDAELTTESFLAIMRTLSKFDAAEALPIIVSMLKEQSNSQEINPMNRNQLIAVISLIGEIGKPENVRDIEENLEDNEWEIRLEAAIAIIKLLNHEETASKDPNA